MSDLEFQINEQEWQEFQSLVQQIETAETDDFLELAKLLGRNPKTDLVGASLVGANLSGADLVGADLVGASLVGANLVGASLVGANLSGADLSGANLHNANLHNATMVGANLCSANLSGADLTGAILRESIWDSTTLFPENSSLAKLKDEEGTTFEANPVSLESANQPSINVIGLPITALSSNAQIALMLEWARCRLSKVVCIANVHILTEACYNPNFSEVLHKADLVIPDGTPLVWMLKLLGATKQNRVAGMDILIALCEQMSSQQTSIFFVGSEPSILNKIRQRLHHEFPNLQIAGMEPLPFRPLTPEEDEAIVQTLNDSGAGVILVSLGCPKQEIWMSQHQGKVRAVMIGLGGAFPVYAGVHKWAPLWIRKRGFEWLYRLIQEPQRLWRRYISPIPIFIWLATRLLIRQSGQFLTRRD